MRIQDKFGALINPWIVFVLSVWLANITLIYAVITGNIKDKIYETQYQELNCQFNTLQEKLKQLKDRKVIMKIDDERLSTLLSLLVKASSKSDAGLGEISIGTVAEYEGNKALPVAITIKGNFNQIGRFINNLEAEDARFQFCEMELSTKETKGAGIMCKLKGYFIIL